MKSRLLLSLIILLLLCSNLIITQAEENIEVKETQIFVSHKDGNDNNSGSKELPVKTISKAIDIAEKYADYKVTVLVYEGDYYENINFDESDKRKVGCTLTIQNIENNYVRLIGAQKVNAKDAKQVSDSSTLNKIPAIARDKVVQIDLQSQGIKNYGKISPINFGKPSLAPPELFINGASMTLSRWPNGEYARIDSIVDQTDTSFSFNILDAKDRPKTWANAKDVWAYGFWYWDWANEGFKIKSISAESGAITTSVKTDARPGQRFYIYNLLEELDEPGEFYVDRESGIMYFYPRNTLNITDDILLSLSTEPLLKFTNTGNIEIKGLEIGYTCERAISAENSDTILIEGCKIQFTGQVGIQAEATNNLTVKGCTITETGAGGVKCTGGDTDTLTPSNNLFIDNEVYRFSRIVKSYTPAFRIEGVGSTVSNNLIHDEEHIAILYNGNDNVIEYNEIYNVCTSTDDSGAIYTGQRWNDRGNIVRYNYLHDITGRAGSYGVSGVYLDDIHSSTKVYGNIFYKVSRAVLVGGGRDNIIENNMILEATNSSTASIVIDARGLDAWFQPNLNPEKGIVYEHLSKVPYQSEIWKAKYPKLYNILNENPKEPRGNIVKNNVIYNHKEMAISSIVKKYGEVSNNFIIDYEDIGFVNYENKDFRLKKDSEVFQEIPEFQPIPIEKVGLLSKKVSTEELSPVLAEAISHNVNSIVLLTGAKQALVYGKKVSVDTNLDAQVLQIDSNIYLPVRFLCEKLGYEVTYDDQRKAVLIKRDGEEAVLFSGTTTYEKDGKTFSAMLAPIVESGHFFVELEHFKNILQEHIYTSKTGIIVIRTDEYIENKKDLSVLKWYLSE